MVAAGIVACCAVASCHLVGDRPPNVLFIVLDTTRADRLSAYGYSKPTSPFLAEFVEGATVFERAIAPSSYTLPSHASMFTGLYPTSHGARLAAATAPSVSLLALGLRGDPHEVRPLSPRATTLAELAHDAGMATGAICGNTAYLSPFFGLDQGFDTYVAKTAEKEDYIDGALVTRLALFWLRAHRKERFFLFLNYVDPHAHFSHDDPSELPSYPGLRVDPAEPGFWYDPQIRYMDDQLAALFDEMGETGALDDTLVVIVGDHGESFGEHGTSGHGTSLYQHEVHVPLLIRRPGQRQGRRVGEFVSLVDLFPTVLQELGIPIPEGVADASLFDEASAGPVVSYLGPYWQLRGHLFAVYDEPWKLLRVAPTLAGGLGAAGELYDLEEDPGETTNLFDERPSVAARLTREITRFREEMQPRFPVTAARPDDDTLRRLRALGYAE